jgi:hypothetical protein
LVPIVSLWLPILLSAVIVFIVSAIIHMMLPLHRNDYRKVPSEDAVMNALRGFNLTPGEYMMPRPDGPQGMKQPEFLDKRTKGPVAILTVFPSGTPNMGPQLGGWFLYSVVVGAFVAFVTGGAVAPGAPYLHVFHFAGLTAFACYTIGLWQNSIWLGRPWSTTFRHTIDGLLYAGMTAGTFGWLWPK